MLYHIICITNSLRNSLPADSVILHIVFHFIFPAIVAGLWFRSSFWRAYLVMMATMLVDVDHLLATPIYDPLRCSIGFHPLHRLIPIIGYVILSFIPKTRWVGLGLVIHMLLDSMDCYTNTGVWYTH